MDQSPPKDLEAFVRDCLALMIERAKVHDAEELVRIEKELKQLEEEHQVLLQLPVHCEKPMSESKEGRRSPLSTGMHDAPVSQVEVAATVVQACETSLESDAFQAWSIARTIKRMVSRRPIEMIISIQEAYMLRTQHAALRSLEEASRINRSTLRTARETLRRAQWEEAADRAKQQRTTKQDAKIITVERWVHDGQ